MQKTRLCNKREVVQKYTNHEIYSYKQIDPFKYILLKPFRSHMYVYLKGLLIFKEHPLFYQIKCVHFQKGYFLSLSIDGDGAVDGN